MSLVVTFTEPLDTLSQIQILPPDYLTKSSSYYPDPLTGRRSLIYWLSPHNSLVRDSIVVALTYPTTDSIGSPISRFNAVTLHAPRAYAAEANAKPKKQSGIRAPETTPSNLSYVGDSTALVETKRKLGTVAILSYEDIHKETTRDSLWISYDVPILAIDTTRVQLVKPVDSVPQPISCQLLPDSAQCCRWLVDLTEGPSTTYRLTVDTVAIMGLYGGISALAEKDLKIASVTELGSLAITLAGYPTEHPLYIHLPSNKEEVLVTAQSDSMGLVTFKELAPGAYFLKLYVDLNNNGSWDGGIHPTTPPEPVRYLPQSVSVQARFATEQKWVHDGTPLAEQHPEDLEGDKPAEDDGSRVNETNQKRGLNARYAQCMRERYGKRWNPVDRERKIMGLPSHIEERETQTRGEETEIGAPPKDKERGDKAQTTALSPGSRALIW